MKKKIWIPIVIAVVVAVLFTPIPTGVYKDGGTREYTALTYKIVDWHRITTDEIYDKTRFYFFPHNFKSIGSLWDYEEPNVKQYFKAVILEIHGTEVTVEPLSDEWERNSSDKIIFSYSGLDDIGAKVGDVVKIGYNGNVMCTYPAQIGAKSWELVTDLRNMEYKEEWLDKSVAETPDHLFDDIKITKIYKNCFFARTVVPFPYEIKINCTLSDEWCVGDQVLVTYKNLYWDTKTDRVEADLTSIEQSDFELEPGVAYKPVIYLYPEKETEISVDLDLNGKLTCTYPEYNAGWNVTAQPNGTLKDKDGKTYNYLYWEGEINADYDFSKGICVKGEETAAFLEIALEKLGLTRREANEFIVYWLPIMQENEYNIISFQTKAYTDAAKLNVSPAPDTTIRVFMTFKASNTPISIPAQELTAPSRNGFTVVEWGGTQIK